MLLVTAAAVIVAVILRPSAGGDDYRVDAVFDSAKGIVPGQLVKIAGARVGRVTDVTLTADRNARLALKVDGKFGPFRQDARCQILPEGFISENYVECTTGRRTAPQLAVQAGTPTVPLAQTTVPVALQDVVDLFSLPVDQRIRALINTLGLGLASRGEDLNAVLRRANPSLTQARKLLTALNGQRAALTSSIVDTDTALAALAERRTDVRGLLASASSTVKVTAAKRRELGETLRRLPGTLDAIDGGLDALNRTTRTGTPLLAELRTAAPGLDRVAASITTFSKQATPAVKAVGKVTRENRGTLTALRPVARNLRAMAQALAPVAGSARQLLDSVRDSGGIENTLRLLYALSTDTASYDGISHIVSIFAGVYPQCIADVQTAGCRHDTQAPNLGTTPVNDPAAAQTRAKPTTAQTRALLSYLLK